VNNHAYYIIKQPINFRRRKDKMKKTAYIGMIVLAVILYGTFVFADGICKDIGEAKKSLLHNEINQAEYCADYIIKVEPGNVEANFLRGKIFFLKSDYGNAKRKFSAEGMRNSRFTKDIADLYKKAGDTSLGQAKFTEAANMYSEAAIYRPEIGQQVANEMFERGKATGNDGYFAVASRLGREEMDKKIGAHLAGQAKTKKTEDEKTDAYGQAAHYDKQYGEIYLAGKEKLGRGYLEQAKQFAKKVGADAQAAKFKTLARKYLGDAAVDAVLPEVLVLTPEGCLNKNNEKGVYVFEIKKGEKTPYRINGPHGQIVNFAYFSNNGKYERRYKKHPPIKVWAGEKVTERIDEDEEYVAVEDTIVGVKVSTDTDIAKK